MQGFPIRYLNSIEFFCIATFLYCAYKICIPAAIVVLLAFLLLPLAESLVGTGQSYVEELTDVVNVVIAVGVGASFGWFIYREDRKR